MQLDDRKWTILKAIVKTYLETGEPVGSRTISKYADLNLSSATIRNEMSDLEEMGYIRRTRFAKSVVITVTFAPFSSGETPASYTGQTRSGLADDLDKALSEWINGNLSDEDMGEICGQYHEAGRKRLADESGKVHSGDKPAIKAGTETDFAQEIVERVAVA